MHYIIELFNHYGYIVLFIALMLELIAFPLPGEALMTYCGYVIYTKKMSWPISIFVATLGVVIGITLAYFIGKILEVGFFEKHGHYIHMDKKRLDRISTWFEKYGNRLLIIAYFIPGVRHVTGYFSGITKVSYRKFAANSYVGALLWTTTFISLGKILGANWEKYHGLMKKYLLIGSLIIAVIIVLIYLYRSYKNIIYDLLLKALDKSLRVFHSLGRVKALIAGVAVLFIAFSALVIGIIQDYLTHEFSAFDEVVRLITTSSFNEDWNNTMSLFISVSNLYVLLSILVVTTIWIIAKGINKLHEIKFMIASFLGAGLLDYILRNVFHRVGPSGTVYTFPSGQSLMVVAAYGFLAYMIIRYSNKNWINAAVIGLYLFVCVIFGLSMVYFNFQYPSDVAGGFEFGGVWLTLIIIIMEVYRVLPKITHDEK